MSVEDKKVSAHIGFEEVDPYDIATPEKNLLLAVLMSALNDLNKQGELGRKATEFFMSSDEDYIFSFRSICDYLSVDPIRVLRITGLAPMRITTRELAARLSSDAVVNAPR